MSELARELPALERLQHFHDEHLGRCGDEPCERRLVEITSGAAVVDVVGACGDEVPQDLSMLMQLMQMLSRARGA